MAALMASLNGARGSARSRLKQVPLLRAAVHDVDLLRKYGTFRPTNFRITGTDRVLYADPREPRGKALLRGHGRGQPFTKLVWTRAIERLRPTTVVDVGANYGEFVFLARYDPGTTVVAIEAHPRLMGFLERSLAAHPDKERISVVWGLASETGGSSHQLAIDPDWSGRSNARGDAAGHPRETVPTVAVDELTEGTRTGPLVFKVDVEGYEGQVMAGMRRLVLASDPVVGILEFNPEYLREAGTDPNRFFAELTERFEVFAQAGPRGVRTVTEAPASGVVDLVLTTQRQVLADLDLQV